MIAHTARDLEILAIFTATDDALQGIIGLHQYTMLANRAITQLHPDLVKMIGSIKLKITHEWVRNYPAGQFFSHMQDSFEFRHCMATLIATFPTLEIALRRFRKRLWHLGTIGHKHSTYREPELKSLLRWNFDLLKSTKAGGEMMRKRLPEVCGDVDNARRLRNLAMHNNSKYNASYIDDAIADGWIVPQFQKGYFQSVANREPIFLVNADVEKLNASMIEFVHMTHNTIQRKFFRAKRDYNYAEEGKAPELFRMTSGRHDVGV